MPSSHYSSPLPALLSHHPPPPRSSMVAEPTSSLSTNDMFPEPVGPAASIEAKTGGGSTSTSVSNSPYSLGGSFSASLAPGVGGSHDDEIEMGSMMGQRRRKSSLMNPDSQPKVTAGRTVAKAGHENYLSIDTAEIAQENGASSSTSAVSWKGESGRDIFSNEILNDEEVGFSSEERAPRQTILKSNTESGQHITRRKNLSAEERNEADKNVVRRLSINIILILLWYLFSLSISLYNKWMFDQDRLNFAFPLFTTSMHMLVQFGLAALVLYFVPSLRPQPPSRTSDLGRPRHETEATNWVMTKSFYFTKIGPCGAATGLDIGLGNTSLKFISLTFYTMCKSSSLAFVLLFAFAFGLEKPTWYLVSIIATMTLGVILMVFGEVEFKLGGFLLVISAAFFSGFRWGLTQIMLLRNPATSNPFSTIFFLSPVMFVTLMATAIPIEGFGPLWEGLKTVSNEWGAVMTPLFLLFPGCIAFLMTASEFALLKRTSVVTLSIAGIFKEVVTISAASLVFKDALTAINVVGLIITIIAIGAYNYVKITKMREEAQVQVQVRVTDHEQTPSFNSTSDLNNEDCSEETTGLLQQDIHGSETPIISNGDIQSISLHSSAVLNKDGSKDYSQSA